MTVGDLLNREKRGNENPSDQRHPWSIDHGSGGSDGFTQNKTID